MFKHSIPTLSSSRTRLIINLRYRFFSDQKSQSQHIIESADFQPFEGSPSERQTYSRSSRSPQFTRKDQLDLSELKTAPDPNLEYDAIYLAMEKKRKFENQRHHELWMQSKQRKLSQKDIFLPEGSNDEVIAWEVRDLLSRNGSWTGDQEMAVTHNGRLRDLTGTQGYTQPTELRQEVELEVLRLSSTGDGLALNEAKDHVFIIPFTVPGDRVLAKPWSWKGLYTVSDFIRVVRPSELRQAEPQCKYFSKCGGCQLQMLPYKAQLDHKRTIVQQAYEIYSGLNPSQIPDVEETFASPLQYGYRTKLSPHFTPPYFNRRMRPDNIWQHGVPPIGFNEKQTGKVMDIENCPLGTDIVNEGLTVERRRVTENIQSYKRGATVLLRETTQRRVNGEDTAGLTTQTTPSDPREWQLKSSKTEVVDGAPQITYEYDTHTDTKTYTSAEKSDACEYITTTIDASTSPPTTKTFKFTNFANSFFQNNNSILGPFTSFVYGLCMPKSGARIKYLLDAYSGSGLFTLTLSPLFTSSLGIDIDANSIKAARKNAIANDVKNAGFLDADASALFADVPYPAHETLVIIDPPRKGCDREFLLQLRRFGAGRVVYVSCNVHTQARDVGVLVNGFKGRDARWEEDGLAKYEIERLRGFDFFPQTGHVEGVCVLNRVVDAKAEHEHR